MQRPVAHWVGVAVALSLLGTSNLATAQESPQALYDEGLKEMLAEQYGSGCPKLQRSYELDPLPGALFTLAACYARWGKVHTAVQRYESYVQAVHQMPDAERKKQADRARAATEKLGALRPQVPTLVLSFASPPPVGVVVELDGQRVAPSVMSAPVPVDPGEHRVTVRWPDEQQSDHVEYLVAGESKTLDLAPPAAETTQPAEPVDDGGGGGSLQTWAFVAGGVGLAGLLVGGITGGMVFGEKGTVEDNCDDAGVCSADGMDAVDSAETLSMVSNIGFVVGAVGLAAGVVLYLVAPDEEPADEVAGIRLDVGSAPGDPTSAVLGVAGRW